MASPRARRLRRRLPSASPDDGVRHRRRARRRDDDHATPRTPVDTTAWRRRPERLARELPGVPRRQRVEPRRLDAPGRRELGELHRQHPRQRRQEPPRRLRRRWRVRHPVHHRARQPAACADHLRRLRRRERPGPVPDPDRRAGRGRQRPPRARRRPRPLQALRAVRRAAHGQPLGRELGRGLRPALERAAPDGWTSADAAGLPIFPGLVRYDEVASGHIDHALRFTVSQTQRGYIHPATHYASSSTDPNRPPMGLQLRLKASFDMSGYTGQARVVLDALKKYGMIVADNGSNWFITGAADSRWNDDDLNQLKTDAGQRVRGRRHRPGHPPLDRGSARSIGGVPFSTRPVPDPAGPGQESVWDYPRPPRLEPVTAAARGGARRRDDRRHHARVPRARDEPSTQLLLPARRRASPARSSPRRARRSASGRAARTTSPCRGGSARSRTRPRGATTQPSEAFAPIAGYVAFYAGTHGRVLRRRRARRRRSPAASTAAGSPRTSSARSRAGPAHAAGRSRRRSPRHATWTRQARRMNMTSNTMRRMRTIVPIPMYMSAWYPTSGTEHPNLRQQRRIDPQLTQVRWLLDQP